MEIKKLEFNNDYNWFLFLVAKHHNNLKSKKHLYNTCLTIAIEYLEYVKTLTSKDLKNLQEKLGNIAWCVATLCYAFNMDMKSIHLKLDGINFNSETLYIEFYLSPVLNEMKTRLANNKKNISDEELQQCIYKLITVLEHDVYLLINNRSFTEILKETSLRFSD